MNQLCIPFCIYNHLECAVGRDTLAVHARDACAEKQNIDSILLRLNLLAHPVHDPYQAHISLDECIFALRV